MDDFLSPREPPPFAPVDGGPPSPQAAPPSFRRYQVNVLVDHTAGQGAPIVYEDLPTVHNLMGRSEHLPQMGALVTDFTLIKPGALHRANGGYLLLDARTVLLQPEPIPLAAKVVLLGEPMLYYLLYQADPEFGELFKVAADFEDQMDRTPEDEWLYARLIATLACGQGLRPSQPHHGAPCGGGGRRTAARAGVAGA